LRTIFSSSLNHKLKFNKTIQATREEEEKEKHEKGGGKGGEAKDRCYSQTSENLIF